jgi:glycosyltransferase involved in cell wall biosynthesis
VRILIVNHYAIPPSSAGGTRHFSLAKELERAGHKVLIVAASYHHFVDQQQVPRGRSAALVKFSGVRLLYLRTPTYSGNGGRRLFNMCFFAERVARLQFPKTWVPFDVVIGSSPHPLAALGASSLSRRLGCPFILEIRDLWPASLVQLAGYSSSSVTVRVLARLVHLLYRRASGVVSLLEHASSHFEQYGVPKARVFFVPNGVDFDLVPKPLLPRAQSDGEFLVTYAGSMGPPNSLDVVLDAAAELLRRGSPVRFDLYGSGADRARLERRVAEEQIVNTRFHDPVPKNAVYGLMQSADALVISMADSPLYELGTSMNKLWDYMAAARPVILSGANATVSREKAGLVVPPGDATALADAVDELRTMAVEDRDAMGLRGRAWIEEHQSMKVLARRLEEAIASVLEGSAAPSDAGAGGDR